MITEKQIENTILEYLSHVPGLFAFKINTMGVFDPKKQIHRTLSRYVAKGTADILCCYRGQFLAIEVKRPKSEFGPKTYPSKDQKSFLEKIDAAGGFAMVARSVDEVIAAVKIMEGRQ